MTRLSAVRLLISCLIIALGSLVVEPAAAESSPAVRIGIVLPDTLVPFYRPSLVQALGALGYVDGDNISLQWKPFGSTPEQARPLVAELLGSEVNMLVAISTPAARVAMDATLNALHTQTTDAVVVSEDLLFLRDMEKIARKIREARLPAMFPWTNYHEYGALMTYGTDLRSRPAQIATFVDRILKGARPSEVPVEQVSKYDLVIDLRVARELKLKVPRELLLRADDVIK